MGTSVSQLHAIDEARDRLGLTLKQIALVLRADESTLQRWRTGVSDPSPVFLNRLESLEEFLAEVRTTFRDVAGTREWLATRAPAFRDQRPLDLLLDGRIERVTAALQAFNTGMTT